MAEITLLVLASGRSLAYGGEMRRDGFTELLAGLLTRYRGHLRHGESIGVTDYWRLPSCRKVCADS